MNSRKSGQKDGTKLSGKIEDLGTWIISIIKQFIAQSPENTLEDEKNDGVNPSQASQTEATPFTNFTRMTSDSFI